MKSSFRSILMIVVALAVIASVIPTQPARADGGSSWGNFFDTSGNLLPGVIQVGEVTQQADWMPDFPSWTGLSLDATYHQYVAPSGETILMPSTSTLFFMAMNPQESGLVDASGQISSGFGTGVELAGVVAGGGGAQFLSALFQTLTGMSQVDADKFADAAVNGQDAWTIFSANTDVMNFFNLFLKLSQEDGNLYLLALVYETCASSPAGCPAELCAANPVACGLPATVVPVATETPEPPRTCPGPSISQASPMLSIVPSEPPYPLAVGQDPDKRGVDISGSISIPPVVLTWYEPEYESVERCSALGAGQTSNCTRANGEPGVLENERRLKECKVHRENLPERINTVTARAELSAESRDWIINDLGSKWYGAYVHQAAFVLTRYGQVSNGCAGGGTCAARLEALGVPFADPGTFNLSITAGTNGTYWNGQQVTRPRILSGKGEVKVYVILPTLIDASTNP